MLGGKCVYVFKKSLYNNPWRETKYLILVSSSCVKLVYSNCWYSLTWYCNLQFSQLAHATIILKVVSWSKVYHQDYQLAKQNNLLSCSHIYQTFATGVNLRRKFPNCFSKSLYMKDEKMSSTGNNINVVCYARKLYS